MKNLSDEMFASVTCQRSCLTEEIDDAAPTSAAQERKIIMRCKSFVDVCNNIFRDLTFVHDATFKNSAGSAEIPRDSIDHGTIGFSPPQTKIILFAQTRRNSRVRRSPFINSPSRWRRGFFREFRVLPRIIASQCSMLSKRERPSQQTEKQRQAT